MARFCHECSVELPTGSGAMLQGRELCMWHYCEAIGLDPRKQNLSSEPPKPPTLESAVRERHEFEDRLAQFLSLAAAMTDRELEVALAKLADTLQHPGGAGSGNTQAKGRVLKLYYSLRLSKAKKLSKVHRAKVGFGIGSISDRLLRRVSEYALVSGSSDMDGDSGDALDERIKYLAP